jgi:amino-acid N-acetyltransferase
VNVSDLREILQYVPRFREKIFVIAVDGIVAASDNFPNILLDIAVLRSLSVRVVLVHGASHQIGLLASQRGVETTNSDGTGITDESTLELAIDASIRLTNRIMEGLSAVDLRAAYANAIIAHPAGILGGKDQLLTGRVERIDNHALELLLKEGIIPVIPPLGFDGEGRTFRVNSDGIALEVAETLHAAKIIFLGADEVVGENHPLPHQLSITESEELIKKLRASNSPAGLISKIECAARACRGGVPRAHLLDGRINEALLTEIFSHEGSGTMVYSNEYQQIRRIYKKDVRSIMSLIRQSVEDEEIARRTRDDILDRIEDYWILEVDRTPIGCVALHIDRDHSLAEMACLYVNRAHENKGFGRKLMAFAENLAREKGVARIYALSTRAVNYLQQKGGYAEASTQILPGERRDRYEGSKRNSKILIKELHPKNF